MPLDFTRMLSGVRYCYQHRHACDLGGEGFPEQTHRVLVEIWEWQGREPLTFDEWRAQESAECRPANEKERRQRDFDAEAAVEAQRRLVEDFRRRRDRYGEEVGV